VRFTYYFGVFLQPQRSGKGQLLVGENGAAASEELSQPAERAMFIGLLSLIAN
jgi:hypothetical protein